MKPSAKLANAPLLPVALNSPAAKVKEGRERGPSVLETLRKQEEAQELADTAKTAKRSRSIAATVARGAVQVRTEWCWCAGSWSRCEECCIGLGRQLLAVKIGTGDVVVARDLLPKAADALDHHRRAVPHHR